MSVNFEVIKNLSADDLQHLTKEQILDSIQIKYDVLKDDGDTCSAFEFAFTQFTDILTLSEINELIFEQILPHLKGKYDEAIACIDQEEDPTVGDELTNLLEIIFQLFLGLSESIHKKLENADEFCLSHVEQHLLNTLHFLCKILPHNLISSQDRIKQWLDAMQKSITQVLACQKLHVETSMDELKTCRKVLRDLIQLGYHQSQKNDVKSMANTWKHLSKLAIDFHTIFHTLQQQNCTELQDHSEDFLDWFEFCIQNICELITNNVEKMLEGTKGTSESLGVTKVTTFFIKLLENLAKVYKNEDFRGHSYLISLYEMTMDISNQSDDIDIKNYLLMINTVLSNVLTNTYNCDRFSNELLTNFSDHHIQISLEVTKLLLQSNITSNDWYLNHENPQRNILHHLLFVCIPKEMIKMYTFECLYDEIVTSCALLISTVSNEQVNDGFEQILIEATLTDDARHMSILMDIWILFLRYASDDTRLLYCNLWLNISRNLSSMPRTPSSVLIQHLLKHTFGLISESSRLDILRDLVQNDLSTLALLGLNCVTNGEVSKQQQYDQQIVNKMKQTFAKLDPKCEIVTSNECLELVNALSSFRPPISPYLLRIINDEQLINCLIDALSRSKTRTVELLLAGILRVLLWQKYLCRNNSVEIDYSDSSEVQKFYALELITIAHIAPDRINVSTVLNSFQDTDDLITARIQKTLRKPNASIQNELLTDLTNENLEYFQEILENERQFGCTTFESCLNKNAIFKRSFEQIIQQAKKLEEATENNPNVNLTQFSDEITFLSDFFKRLQTV